MSEKIKAQHVQRKAMLYIRQSSPYQVKHNVESKKLQYGMQARLQQLGWREIEIVDEDLGRSAGGMVTRCGFERMVAEVCLGKVGAVAAREVSRFARNSRDWQKLVEVCRVVDTVLIDQETVYAPRQSNDRLLLGLKGSLNEYELDLLRQRALEARVEKARRGELIVASPAGYLKSDHGLEKDPDRRVQKAIELVFRKFAQLGSVRQTLLWFLEYALQLPAQSVPGQIQWKTPTYATVYKILTNPVYGGAYAYGKTGQSTHYEHNEAHQARQRKPRDQWLALIPNAHEGYVSWEEFEKVQQDISGNCRGKQQPGAAREGQALLAGVLRCRRCGHKLLVSYTGRQGEVLRYVCSRSWLDTAQPRCIAFGGLSVDEAIGREVLRVVQPAAMEAAILASEEHTRKQDDVLQALRRDLEAARYVAQRAHKQYDAADPENRLVADELERRWNQALQRVHALEAQIDQHVHAQDQEKTPEREELVELAAELQAVWPEGDARLKKRIVRTLIQEIVVDVDGEAGEVILVIHWKGGVHTELRLPRRRRGHSSAHTSQEIVGAVRTLSRICSDEIIAGVLNRNALLTGHGNRWTKERVTSLRSHHHIAVYSAQQRASEGWMNLTEAARFLGLNPRTLRLAVERGEIEAQHPLSEGPWVFSRNDLTTSTAAKLKKRVARENRKPAIPMPEQGTLELSNT